MHEAMPAGLCWALALIVAASACGGRSADPDSLGIRECDEYVSRMQACQARDAKVKALAPALAAQRDVWKQTLYSEPALVRANCKMMLDGFTKAMPQCR